MEVSNAPCERHEMAFCALCAKKDGPIFKAQWDGECGVCGQHIDAGTEVRWSDDGQTIAHTYH